MAKKNDIKNKWYSWGSPIGMAIFFVGLAIFIILVSNFT